MPVNRAADRQTPSAGNDLVIAFGVRGGAGSWQAAGSDGSLRGRLGAGFLEASHVGRVTIGGMSEAMEPRGRVLVVAGSDSGGGAGIQADIKTITVLGGYAATAVTALTAQNTLGVFGVLPIDPEFVAEQMAVVLTDIGADAVKTGMLFSEELIVAVASMLELRARRVPVIVDPVMVAKGGASLLQQRARAALVERLLPLAALITPNAPEAAALAGIEVENIDDMERAADRLLAFGAS